MEKRFSVAVNSTPLIYLSKANSLWILTSIFKVFIDNIVYEEVVLEGIKKGFKDALSVKKFIDKGEIITYNVDKRCLMQLSSYNIGLGEASTISLVINNIADIAIIDDKYARIIAEKLGVKVHGTPYILKLSVLKKIIKPSEAIKTLELTVKNGYYLTAKTR